MISDKDIVVLGVLEFSSIAVGFNALDEMVKIAPIKIIDARTISQGKYLIIFSGDLASVEYSFKKGIETGREFIVDRLMLPMVHPEVVGALGNTKESEQWETVGIIETLTVTSSIESADMAAKESNVKIIEIRLANGYGGKSYVKMIGSIEDVQASMFAGSSKAKLKNTFCAETIIPQPHNEIKEFFLKKP